MFPVYNATISTVVVGPIYSQPCSWISQPSHMVSVKQYRMLGKGKRMEGKVSVLIKELIETGVLKEPIQQLAQTALPLWPLSPNETSVPHVSVTDNYVS